MLVVGISGSPRKGGNTDLLLDAALQGAQSQGAEVKKFYLAEALCSGCLDCGQCLTSGHCHLQDEITEIYQTLEQAAAVILASPVYFENVTSWMKTFIDRGQPYWHQDKHASLTKPGLFISVAARLSTDFTSIEKTVRVFFLSLGIKPEPSLLFAGFEEQASILDDPSALEQARAAGIQLVGRKLH